MPPRSRLLPLAGLVLLSAAPAGAQGDKAVFELIDALRPVAEAIAIDGHGSDWGAIPTFPDPVGDNVSGGPEHDITGVAIAPTADALLVRIDTAGTPPSSGREFWIELDFTGQQWFDVKLSFHLDWLDDLDAFPEGVAPPARVQYAQDPGDVAVASVFEARIPYAQLDALLPASMQGKLTGPGARPWVRVRATTGEPLDSLATERDHGSAVGSFRLVDTPYALDPSLPAAPAGAETPLPMHGLWYVGQGSHGVGSHAALPWAYDLHQTDNALLPEEPQGSTDNDDNFSFGAPLLAPLAGSVFSLENDEVDIPAHTVGATPANFLFLEVPGDVGLLFSHTRQGSIPLAPFDPVARDQQIGAVGNSGSSQSWAHLHYEAQDINSLPDSLPIALTQVEVGLNPTASDPWRRRFDVWDIREGFFVRRKAAPVPALGPGSLAALAVLLGLLGAARLTAARPSPRAEPRSV